MRFQRDSKTIYIRRMEIKDKKLIMGLFRILRRLWRIAIKWLLYFNRLKAISNNFDEDNNSYSNEKYWIKYKVKSKLINFYIT